MQTPDTFRCPICGHQLETDAERCPNCDPDFFDAVCNRAQESAIKCPKCGSTQLTANTKGFGVGKAAVGGLLLGPVGLLGGFIWKRQSQNHLPSMRQCVQARSRPLIAARTAD
jgi:RNA polymerase subunit RPABC4/transcription elongation factor Spt4